MKFIKEKVAYIQGLADGLGVDTTSNEGRIIDKILDVLGDITDALDGVAEAHDELEDYVEMIDDDMTDLESYLLDYEDDDDDDFDDEDEDFYEVICPSCGSAYLTDFESFEEDDVFCPECGEKFTLEEKVLEGLTHSDDCQCGQHHE